MSSLLARRRWWREMLLVVLVYAAYDGSRLLVTGALPEALRNAHHVLGIERFLRLSPEHWLNGEFTAHAWLAVPADFAYATLHYLVTPLVLVWLWRRHHDRYREARTWLALSTVLGLAGFVALPTAPPRLLEASYGFTDSMQQHASVGWWGAEASAPKGLGHLTNQFAAMPSLHVGWALWCGVALFRFASHRLVRVAGLLYPLAITLVVMGTANHYLLDAFAGCAVMTAGFFLTRPALRLLAAARTALGRHPAPATARTGTLVVAGIPTQQGRADTEGREEAAQRPVRA